MSTLVGMDTEVVTDLANGLIADADRLNDVAVRLRVVVDDFSATSWRGTDSQQFCGTWRQVHDPALVALSTRLRELGQQALVEAADQDRVSDASGSGAAFGNVVGGSDTVADFANVAGGADTIASRYADDSPVGGRHDRDMMALAIGTYPGENIAATDGRYSELTQEQYQKLGITQDMLIDPVTGFAAKVYQGADGSTVIAFRGSDGFGNIPDFGGTNIPNGMGLPSLQGAQAIKLAQHVAARVGAGNVAMVGHSLGGHLAVTAAIATGAKAVTFNGARVGDTDFARALIASGRDGNMPGVMAKLSILSGAPLRPTSLAATLYDPHAADRAAITASGQIRNYSTKGEILTTIQAAWLGPRPIGEQVLMDDPGTGLANAHGPDGMLENYDKTFGRGR